MPLLKSSATTQDPSAYFLSQPAGANLTRLDLRSLRRRTFLSMGGLATLGVTLPDQLGTRRALQAAGTKPSAKACILLYMTGGPPQQETFDPKPDAPEAPRGQFRPIATSVPGTQISELLPRLAANAHRYTIIRSVHHEQTFHGGGSHYNLTGFPHAPRVPTPEFYLDRRDCPSIGAVIEKLRGPKNGLPAAVQLPWWIGRFPHCSRIWTSGDCWPRRWSCGLASSVARQR